MLLRSIVLLLGLVNSLAAYGKDIEPLYRELKDVPEHYEIVGTVCEQAARLQMIRQYPATSHEVITGIAYMDKNRTIGELDVIVFEKKSSQAVLIAEVKCWKNMRSGLNKAREQRARFIKTMRERPEQIEFRSVGDHRPYPNTSFRGDKRFISIAQLGSRQAGYETELEYTLEELMEVRQMLIDCQKRGECKKPD